MDEEANGKKRKRGAYRIYETNPSCQIPRTTLWRQNKKRECANNRIGEVNEEPHDNSEAEYDWRIDQTLIMNHPNEHIDEDGHDDDDDDDEEEENNDYADDVENDDDDDGNNNADNDSEAKVEDNNADRNQTDPLYAGARISKIVSMILIIAFITRHQLSGEAVKDLLTLIEVHCLIPNLCEKNLNLFNRFFKGLKSPVETHYFCKFCKSYIGPKPTEFCLTCGKNEQRHFMYIPIAGQLQSILADYSFKDLKVSERKKKCESNIEDVYDGKYYKDIFRDGYIIGTPDDVKNSEVHISLQLNTDGVSLFKSSNYAVWPLYLVINELEPSKRYSSEKRIFAGLWFGESKPIMSVLLKPLVQELQYIFEKGIRVKLMDKVVLLRAVLLSVVCDAPARCLVQNFVQFNGYYGCASCMVKGNTVKTSIKGSMMAFPYDISPENNQTGHVLNRTHEETIQNAKVAEENSSPHYGVKGFSILYELPYFNIIRSVTVDYMHCVLLGIQKMLLHYWTDTSHKQEKYYIGDYISVIDDRIKALSPPHLLSRMPRSLGDLKNWKASEFKSFLLYHSVPCLYGILSDDYYFHYLCFVEAIYLLLQSSISLKDQQKAKILIQRFCASIDYMYSPRMETSNVHALLHIVEKVKDLGPLWSHSCFFYEDLNGDLRALFHGTQKVELQISAAVVVHQQLPSLEEYLPLGSEAESFYFSMKKRKSKRNRTFVSDDHAVVGSLQECELTTGTIKKEVGKIVNGFVVKSRRFLRLLSNGILYHSKEYKCVTKRNSYTVIYEHNGQLEFGQVQYYLEVMPSSLDKLQHFGVVKKLAIQQQLNERLLPCHMYEVQLAELKVIPIKDIREMCVFMKINSLNKCFVAQIPNLCEKD